MEKWPQRRYLGQSGKNLKHMSQIGGERHNPYSSDFAPQDSKTSPVSVLCKYLFVNFELEYITEQAQHGRISSGRDHFWESILAFQCPSFLVQLLQWRTWKTSKTDYRWQEYQFWFHLDLFWYVQFKKLFSMQGFCFLSGRNNNFMIIRICGFIF